MKYLFFVRHAKAEKASVAFKDFDRELAYKGQVDAPRMAKILSEYGVKAERLISSPALRTKQTAILFAQQLRFDLADIVYEPEFYEASVRTLLRIINSFNDSFSSAMIFGHNPSFSHLPEYLTQEIIGKVPTCGVVLLQFNIDTWAEISGGIGSVVKFWYPESN